MHLSIRLRVVKLLQEYMLEKNVAFADIGTTLCMLTSLGEVEDLFGQVELNVNEPFIIEICKDGDLQAVIDILDGAVGALLSDEAFATIVTSVTERTKDLKAYSLIYSIALLRFRRSGNTALLPQSNEIAMKLVNSPSVYERDTGHKLAMYSDLPLPTKLTLLLSCFKGKPLDKRNGLYILSRYLRSEEWAARAMETTEFWDLVNLVKRLTKLRGKNPDSEYLRTSALETLTWIEAIRSRLQKTKQTGEGPAQIDRNAADDHASTGSCGPNA